MDGPRLREIEGWARGLAQRDDDLLSSGGRTLLALVAAVRGETGIDPDRIQRIRQRALLLVRSDDQELRAVARAVSMLVRELEDRFQSPGAAGGQDPDSSSAVAGDTVHKRVGLTRQRWVVRTVATVGALLLFVVAFVVVRGMLVPQLQVSGPADGSVLGKIKTVRSSFVARGRAADWVLDGREVTRRVGRNGGVLRLAGLAEGRHVLVVRSSPDIFGDRRVRRVGFLVDRTGPQLRLPAYFRVVGVREKIVLRGGAVGAVQVSVDGRRAALARQRFSVSLKGSVRAAVDVVAVDAAGNTTRRPVRVVLEPRRPPIAVRAVHVTGYGWSDPKLRAGVMSLVATHRINSVELDLKDESGIVDFGSDVPLAHRIGAAKRIYDLSAAVRDLHARGVWVIGRLVCFRDPLLATNAWKHGQRDWVIQTPAGRPYAGYGGFTNFANPAVRRYQLDIAVAAARAGIDDVLYDYVRRPDGPISSMRFPG